MSYKSLNHFCLIHVVRDDARVNEQLQVLDDDRRSLDLATLVCASVFVHAVLANLAAKPGRLIC